MKVLLMFRDRDFDLRQPPPPPWKQRDRAAELLRLPCHQRDLIQDLELPTLLHAMAGEDTFVFDVAQQALLDGCQNGIETVLYRQEIVQDCLNNASVVRDVYRLATETIEASRRHSIGGYWATPQSILYAAVEALQIFVGALRNLKTIAVEHDAAFRSRGLSTMLAMMRQEFTDDYFRLIEQRLDELKFPQGVWVSAGLGHGNEGRDYVLRRPPEPRPWIERLLKTGPPAYTFHIPERDDAGFKALGELRDRGINLVANAVAQSAEHILSFFEMLRTELAFYIGCVNLYEKLVGFDVPLCFPEPRLPGGRRHHFRGLSDVCLALTMGRSIVGNDLDADGKDLVIITGANQGGKSTFLRSIGLAQVMMQSGMFVAADSFSAELCVSLFTHYKREEDTTMQHGKLDEELARMSDLADVLALNGIVLFNESFASTNEREGSELAGQIVRALCESGIKVFFVTHLYAFTRGVFDERGPGVLFLRADRGADGTRTFRIVEGEPLQTSYGHDVYKEVFMEA